MNTENRKRPIILYVLIALLIFQGLSGIFGGIFLIADPTGATLNIPIDWLEGSPFSSYFIPGLILLIVLGIFPLYVIYLLWIKSYFSKYSVMFVGIALILWIVVQIVFIGYGSDPPLQAIYGFLGLLILILSLSPSMKNYYK